MAAAAPGTDTETPFNNEMLKKIFHEMHETVVAEVSRPSVWGHLFQEKIIDARECSILHGIKPEQDAGRKLLLYLHDSRDGKAFVKLREALRDVNWLIDEIDARYLVLSEEWKSKRLTFSPSSSSSNGIDGDKHLRQFNDVRFTSSPQVEGVQPIDAMTPQLQQLFDQFVRFYQQATKNNSIGTQSLNSSSDDYVEVNQEDNVYEALTNIVKQNVSSTVQRWRDDHALIAKDVQYNIAVMSAQNQSPASNKEPRFTRAEGDPIRTVASLGTMLYLVREMKAEIECYEMESGRLTDKKSVTTPLKDPRDMAACSHHLILYIKDVNDTIHWVSVGGDESSNWWPINEKSGGISVSSRNQLLIACPESKKIKVMTHEGTEVRCIRLESSVSNLWHAVELCTGKIVLSYGNSYDRESKVCIVDDNSGEILRQYVVKNKGKTKFVPLRLAVCGNIFVLDFDVGVILRLTPTLDEKRVVKVTNSARLPLRFCIDERGRNMYIADTPYDESQGKYTSGRIVVVPLVVEES